jgi:hypothetical protein
MNKSQRLILIPLVPLLFAACGGGPDIDKVKEDFNNPSGSVSSKEAIIAANGERDASGPGISLAGGGVPGAALMAARSEPALEELSAMRGFSFKAESLFAALKAKSKQQALSAAQFETNAGCHDSEVAREAYADMISDLFLDALNPLGGDLDGSADYELDLASCSEGRLSGNLEVELEVELSENRFVFRVTENFDNVCEIGGVESCVNGELIMEAEANNSGSAAENFTFVVAWELDTRWNDSGTSREATVSGGLRLASMTTMEMATSTVEYLFYVNTPEGDEASYVFRATADEMGNGTLEIRGRDGSLTCSVNDGGGMCTSTGTDGMATLTWTAAEAAGLPEEYYED